MSNQNNIDRVRGKLIKQYSGSEVGIWEVLGEDSNCDFGGAHHMPTLGYFKGRYEDVVEYALQLSGFFQWGSGGNISRIKIHDIDKNSSEDFIKAKDELLKAKLAVTEAERKLKSIGGDS